MVKYWCAAIKYARITSLEALLCEKRTNGPYVTNDDDTGYPHDGRADKNSYPYDGRADKDSYPHDGRAEKDSYPHDRHNQYIIGNIILI